MTNTMSLEALNTELANAVSVARPRFIAAKTRQMRVQPGAKGTEIATMPNHSSMESAILAHDVFQGR